tara:strand:+ start:15743 stop:16345 length:603 start_codon:yes stop_codon:yes gene_type:complete
MSRLDLSAAKESQRPGNYFITTKDALGESRVLFGPFMEFGHAREYIKSGELQQVLGSTIGLEDSLSRVRIVDSVMPRTAELNQEMSPKHAVLIQESNAYDAPENAVRVEYSNKLSKTFVVGTPLEIAHHLAQKRNFSPITTPIPREGGFVWLSEQKDSIIELRGVTRAVADKFNAALTTIKKVNPELTKNLNYDPSGPGR